MSGHAHITDLLESAVRNNAEWCQVIARAHGLPGRFEEGLWVHPEPMPPFYPNAVTLPSSLVARQQARLASLVAGVGGLLSVKDSFCCLDLQPLGFRPLFKAEWIFRPPYDASGLLSGNCRRIVGEDEVCQWELAWGQTPPGVGRIFPADLLANPDVAMIAIFDRDEIVAGCIGNSAHGVVGWSNVFGSLPDVCLAALTNEFPELPIVDYEREADLLMAKSLGFKAIGELQIWTRDESTGGGKSYT
ncbi:MAG: hypothetical protein ACRDHX_15925 [Chloroflexota bacterium]